MKYPQIVAMARLEAVQSGQPQIVYETTYEWKNGWAQRWIYNFSSEVEFERTLASGNHPMRRLLKCMPDGAIMQ